MQYGRPNDGKADGDGRLKEAMAGRSIGEVRNRLVDVGLINRTIRQAMENAHQPSMVKVALAHRAPPPGR
jgi:hypothetical protein